MDWRDFSGGEDEESTARLAAIHAKARYLMLYLQEQGKLVKVYKNFQARDVGADSVKLLERTLGEKLDMTEAAFQRWFGKF